MTAQEYMKQAKILIHRIQRKRREAEDIRMREAYPSSPAYSDTPITTSPNPNRISDEILHAIQLEKDADAIFSELQMLKSRFQKAIDCLENPDDKDLLYKRYIEFKEWKQIAHEIGYSESHTKRLHSNIMKKLIHDDTP